ncbi:SRPBCC family protein [Chitinophaga sp. 22620]|uniref:SRPBCC family protein n=1 Tax=Chitinophaga sp. 22620 TaxID=3453952 RepID=UPI003F83DE4A
MTTKHQMQITKDASNKKLVLTREFDAEPKTVWQAYTTSKMLDQWWAPRPWKAETKSMDFKEGGTWLYAMVGPEGEKHWAKATYGKINAPEFFTVSDMFCDEQGNPTPGMPQMDWRVEFSKTAAGTKVTTYITFASEEDLQKIVEMGFEQGIAMAADNLDELLAK